MTRDDPVVVPGLDSVGGLREALPVFTGCSVPQEALLPGHFAAGVHNTAEELGQQARGGVDAGPGELLGGGQVEEQVGLDQGAGGLVQEDELLVLM